MPKKEKLWDVVIIGGGPAGCSAAMVLARSRRSVLIIDEGKQRNLRSHGLHNFITRDGILPPDFLSIAYNELGNYPVSFVRIKALRAVAGNNTFSITDANNNIYRSKKILFATGVCDNIPDIPGMKELWGTAIFHCPFCDGFECKENHIGNKIWLRGIMKEISQRI